MTSFWVLVDKELGEDAKDGEPEEEEQAVPDEEKAKWEVWDGVDDLFIQSQYLVFYHSTVEIYIQQSKQIDLQQRRPRSIDHQHVDATRTPSGGIDRRDR